MIFLNGLLYEDYGGCGVVGKALSPIVVGRIPDSKPSQEI
jgi:hypothetical protein